MKKVLILAYDFPPYVSVGGIRPYNWYKFLHKYDVYPIVITRQWANKYKDYRDYIAPGGSKKAIMDSDEKGCIIRTPYTPNLANRILLKYGKKRLIFLRKSVSAFYEFTQFLFPIGPKRKLYQAAKKYLKNNQVDVIMATGDPFVLFKYASTLGKKFNIPWIADYRDPWTHDHTKKKNILIEGLNAFFERRTVSTASCVVTVSEFFKQHILEIVPGQICHIIPNGYDPDAVKEAQAVLQRNDVLSIGYAGTIPDWCPLDSFLKVCHNFLQNKKEPRFQINFFGIDKEDMVKKLISDRYPSLNNIVNIYPKTSNMLLLKEIANNNLFLLFNSYSIMGTKIYDYIALKRMILLCYSDDKQANELKKKHFHINDAQISNNRLLEDLIKYTHSGITVKDEEHLVQMLDELYKEFLLNGFIKCDTVNTETLSREVQTKMVATIIKELS